MLWDPREAQFRVDALHAAVIGLFVAFYTSSECSITGTEYALVEFCFMLRGAIIAAKYAHYDTASLAQLDRAPLSASDIYSRLVLVGWIAPPPELMARELERAISRAAPHFARHVIVFPSETDRDAALRAMARALPTYNALDLGVPLPDVADGTCAGSDEASDAAIATFRKHVHPALLSSTEVPGTALGDDPRWMEAGGLAPPAMPGLFDEATVSARLTRGQSSPRLLEAHLPAAALPRLPSLPAKLLLWHLIFLRYCSVSYAKVGFIATVFSSIFGFLPSIVHAIGYAIGMRAPWYAQPETLVQLVAQGLAIAQVGWPCIMFLLIGVIDLTRRLQCEFDVIALLDAHSRGALRLHDDASSATRHKNDGAATPRLPQPVAFVGKIVHPSNADLFPILMYSLVCLRMPHTIPRAPG